MTEAEYLSLCAACDRLLLAPDAGPERVAIPWLHVIRPHPIFLPSYADLFGGSQPAGPGKRLLRSAASAAWHLGRAVLSTGRSWEGEAPDGTDILIISHLVNEAFAGQDKDFYYDHTATELTAQGLRTTIALINYTKIPAATLAAGWRTAEVPRLVFSPVQAPLAEFSLYRRACSEARRLYETARMAVSDLERRIARQAAQEAVAGGTVAALRFGEQVRELVARLRPRAIVVTYEGHSWERIAFAAARSVVPGIICIGYQHAALFNLQHAAQRRLSRKYDPDVILTSGQIAKRRLEKNAALEGIRISVMGSSRSFTRQPGRSWQLLPGARRACIVLPEGVASECDLLFGFSLECAKAMPDIDFIWRLHPNMNYDMLTRKNPGFRHLPSNVVLSKRSIDEDIARSHWALYRGSTAIVQAAVSGVWPIYLRVPGEISVDTLFEIEACRSAVATVDEFDAVVASREASGVMTEEKGRLQDYCEQMFTPLDSRALAACLAEG